MPGNPAGRAGQPFDGKERLDIQNRPYISLYLIFSLFFGKAITFLKCNNELGMIAIDLSDILIGELSPPGLYLAANLFPVALNNPIFYIIFPADKIDDCQQDNAANQ
jgi:hypothetical protein